LRRWATEIILKRAPTTVLNKQAYLKTSLREFLQNLPAEAQDYLAKRAESFYTSRFVRDPHAIVQTLECFQFLIDEANLTPIPRHILTTDVIAEAELDAAVKCHFTLTESTRQVEDPAAWQRLKDSIAKGE
jgi:hypothetical protein